MNQHLANILSHTNKDIDNQKLMDYLSKKLSEEEAHELEKQMADDAFVDDAVEGLGYFSNPDKLPDVTTQLNQQLQKHLAEKKQRREKRRWKDNPMVYLVIVVLMLLLLTAFFLVRKKLQDNRNTPAVTSVVSAAHE